MQVLLPFTFNQAPIDAISGTQLPQQQAANLPATDSQPVTQPTLQPGGPRRLLLH